MLILAWAFIQLIWPLVLKILGYATAMVFSVFVSMVIDECSEDTIK